MNCRRICKLAVICLMLAASVGPSRAAQPDWVTRSDENTQIVIDLFAKYLPEIMGRLGVEGVEESIMQLPLDLNAKSKAEEEEVLAVLRERRARESDAAVRQDLDILIDLIERDLEQTALEERLLLPYFDLPEQIFLGIRGLLDDQIPEETRAAALVRLRRYAGLEEGYTPLARQAEAYIRAQFDKENLLGPYRDELEKDLVRGPLIVEGLGKLFEEYGIAGYEDALTTLSAQLTDYQEFLRQEVLPRARDDYRLPPELYAIELEDMGVDMPVAELVSRAKVAFKEIQNEMQALAPLVAQQRGWPSSDYRDVIRELKKEQLVGEEILARYTERIEKVEEIIRREEIATLPQRPMRLRLATEAERAVVQAATIRWPQLLGEAAAVGEIILPLTRLDDDGSGELQIDDFTSDAASWSLIVHEGRPGHEQQMASILEKGVSKARAFFAFNNVNVEGWALYAESEMKPYLPLEGQLISLQYRLLRAARAFLDPGLQSGEITPEEVMRILTEEAVFSEAVAQQELERYTSRNPGQATAYFCGYSRLLELRADAERMLGEDFDRRAFNDFILAQGLLPPRLLRQAVMEELAGEPLRASRPSS